MIRYSLILPQLNHYALQQECSKNNVKFLRRNELYCKKDYGKPDNKDRYHLVLIAMNQKGLENIRKIQRLSVSDHFYYKPLTPHPLIFENTEGIFCSTACALSYINNQFLQGNDEEAYDFFGKLLDAFGKDNVAIELQYHPTWKNEKGEYPQNYLNEKKRFAESIEKLKKDNIDIDIDKLKEMSV